MAVFRVEKNRNYTVMSNIHLKDKGLSLKAKGLLSMILSLPEDWNYTTRGLAAICKEGVDSIGGTLRELEGAGYLVRKRLRDRNGRISDTEYVIFEAPRRKPDAAAPCTENPDMETQDTVAPDTDRPAQFNTQGSNTQIPHTKAERNHTSNPDQSIFETTDGDTMDEVEYRRTKESVREQIEYEALDTPQDHDRLDEIVELMTETLCTRRKSIRVGGEHYPVEVVKARFRKLNMHHIEYIFGSLDRKHTEVRNIRQYLMTTLYNAPVTMNNYYDAEVRSAGIL